MTLKEFEQITDLQVEITVLTRRLQKTYDKANQFTSDFAKDYRTGKARPISFTGYTVLDAEKADEISEKINRHREKLQALILRAEEYILSVEESRVRTLLSLKYLEGKTWKEAAKAFYKMSEETARVTVQRYFEAA